VSVILGDYLGRDMTARRVPQRYDGERPVTDKADKLARLIAFIDRDAGWQPNRFSAGQARVVASDGGG
jgi:hypothetical protein